MATLKDLLVSGPARVIGNITGKSFIKEGGTSSQFLKADGSVDSNSYSTTSHNHSGVYKPVQTAVSDPTASSTTSTTFIDSISQNANGVITATKKTLPSYASSSHTHTTTIATSTGTNQITLAHGSKYAITAGGTSYVFTMPAQYSHPSYTATTAGAYKIGNDATGHVVIGAALAKGDVGLGNVENKSSATIRSEITSSNVTTALGFTPASSSHHHSNIITAGDNRDVATKPSDYANKIVFVGLKKNSTIGINLNTTYSYVIGLRGWSDSSGGNAHEMAFNDKGLYLRNGATTEWNNWNKVLTDSDIGSSVSSQNHNHDGVYAAASHTHNYAASNHTHTTTIATSTGTNQITLEHGSKYAITAGGTSYVFTMPAQYSHPTSAGNKHIPSGGSSGQFLGWSASGTAAWVGNPNTDHSVDQIDFTDSSLWHGIMLSHENITDIDFGKNTLRNFNGDVGFSNKIFLNPSSGAIVSMGGYYDANGNSVSYEGHTHDYSASNHTHNTSIATSSATNQITLAFGTKYAITAGGTSYVFTMPSLGTTSTTAAAGNHTHSGYLTSSSSLNAANLTGTIPSDCYTDSNYFGTVLVETSGGDASKVGIVNFPYTLNTGNCFILYLKQDNTVAKATLNIMNTGAKDVYLDGEKVKESNWKAGTYLFYYDGERYHTSSRNPFIDKNTKYTIATGDSNGQIKVTPSSGNEYNVNVKGLGSAAYTASTAYASSSHSHGSITSDGKISSGTALANGDAIVFADSSDSSKLKKSTITFDGSTTTKFLSQKGTWETPSGGGGGSTVVGKTVELSTTNQALITVNGSDSGKVKLPDYCPWIANTANNHDIIGGVTPIFRADTPKVEINGNVGDFSDIKDVSGVNTKFLFPQVGKSHTLFALPVVMDKNGRLFVLISEALATDVFLKNSMSTDAGDLRDK